MNERPTIGRIVWYRTDGRNGLAYDLPAIVTCTRTTHPGDYPCGWCGRTDVPKGEVCPALEHSEGDGPRLCARPANPLPVPDKGHVHLTVFTPGGVGSVVGTDDPVGDDSDYVGARSLSPGSGTYVEWNVPHSPAHQPADCDADGHDDITPRSWRWPTRG